MNKTCPSCLRRQDAGLLCSACCDRLERDLGDVRALVEDLDVSLSKQAKIGEASGPGGLARERNPISVGAMQAADVLTNVLTTWARDVVSEHLATPYPPKPAVHAAFALLSNVGLIRRHPAVDELMDEITDAVAQARNVIDRPANRTIIFVGPCPELDENGAHCPGEVYAFIPTEDDRPSRMECRTDKVHRWSSIQFYRTGKRIADRQQQIKDASESA